MSGLGGTAVDNRPSNGVGWTDVLPKVGRDAGDVLRAVIGMSPLAMVLTDPHAPDQPVVYCNRAFVRLTGYTEEETIGRNCRFLQGPDTNRSSIATLSEAVRAGGEVQVDLWNYRKDGTRFWNSMFVGPITDVEGGLLYYFGSQIDSSARQEAEEAANRNQRLDSLGSMAAGLAHEINNLMTVIVGNVEGLRKVVVETRPAERLSRIEWAAGITGKLTRQMLSFAGRHLLEAQPLDLNVVLRDLEPLLKQVSSAGVGIALKLGPVPLPVSVDLGQLELALINLVKNAADASPQEDAILIATTSFGRDQIRWAEIAVIDTGNGMSADVRGKATDPFFTTKGVGKGTGLGLSMVAGFCKESGGRLEIESQAGKGTTIRMEFPMLEVGS